ncbi:glutathione S-transferase C-terminal domain-containing protein [Bradyrhizobium sp. 27S5]|uniref:glutathione S-transferase C-terminal domain-containing protein n=1 Tax=Bradyrhizobium sp. 27S5 TaxID=3139728 RepID=UPI0030CD4314
MKLMINGVWRGDVDPTPELEAQRMIHTGSFRDRITSDGSSGFAAEPGRYHLYVSHACPFSHRITVVHAMKRLEGTIGLSVAHAIWDTPDGWRFGETDLSTPDHGGNGFTRLHEAYRVSQSDYTGKILVPVLWDRTSRRIVNNESLEICLMLNQAFDEVGGDSRVDLYPAALCSEIDLLGSRINRSLATGVYEVAAASNQAEYDRAVSELFGFLDECEAALADDRCFLFGERTTLADVLIFTPLVRFDAVYNPLFRASKKRLVDYPRLTALVKRIHDLPGVAATVRLDHILTHYYDGDWAVANRRGIVPHMHAVSWITSGPGA